MNQLIAIDVKQFNKNNKRADKKYLASFTIDKKGEMISLSVSGDDLAQIIWWIEWKITKELTDGEVSMDVQ